MNLYINQGRFGEFVRNVVQKEYEHKREKRENDDDWKLWVAYIHGIHEESFVEWKKMLLNKANQVKSQSKDENLSKEQTVKIINGAFEAFH